MESRQTATGEAVAAYLDLFDRQREAALASLAGLSEAAIWRQPAPKQWSIGEVLDHLRVLNGQFVAIFRVTWAILAPLARLRRGVAELRPGHVEIDDVYRRPRFPMKVGWMWPPRYTPERPVPLAVLGANLAVVHGRARAFYEGKDPELLAHVSLYDPAIGRLNLVQALRVGVYHDELHFEQIRAMIE